MARITIHDRLHQAIHKMAEGNPGAIKAIISLYNNAPVIDPDNALWGFGHILALDELEIYGSSIYILWNDKCGRDLRKMILLLRGVQLGFIPSSRVKEMSEDQCNKVNLTQEEWENLGNDVCSKLKNFKLVENIDKGFKEVSVKAY